MRTPSIQVILETVAKLRNITVVQIQSKERTAGVVAARNEIFWLTRQLTDLPYEKIGRYVGDRHHTSVINSENTVTTGMARDENYSDDMTEIKAMCLEAMGMSASQSGELQTRPDVVKIANRVLYARIPDDPITKAEVRILCKAIIASDKAIRDQLLFVDDMHIALSSVMGSATHE